MSLKVSLFILVLASMLSTADLLRCYVCGGVKCTSAPLTCPANADLCIKYVRSLPDGQTSDAKTCGTQADCRKTPDGEPYCCNTDLCNSAGTTGKNLLLLLTPLASIFVLS